MNAESPLRAAVGVFGVVITAIGLLAFAVHPGQSTLALSLVGPAMLIGWHATRPAGEAA